MSAWKVSSIDKRIEQLLGCESTEAFCECLNQIKVHTANRATLLDIYSVVDSRVGFHACYRTGVNSNVLQRLLRAQKTQAVDIDKSTTDWAELGKLAAQRNDSKLLESIAKHPQGRAAAKTAAIRALRTRITGLITADDESAVSKDLKFIRGVADLPSDDTESYPELDEVLSDLADGCRVALDDGGQDLAIAKRVADIMTALNMNAPDFMHTYLSKPISSPKDSWFLRKTVRELGMNESVYYGALLDRLGADIRLCKTGEREGLRSAVAILGELRPIDRLSSDGASVDDIVAIIDALACDGEHSSRCWSDADGSRVGLVEAILLHTDLALDVLLKLYSGIHTMQDFTRLEPIRKCLYPSAHHFAPVLARVAESLDMDQPDGLKLAISIYARYSLGTVTDAARGVFMRALTSDCDIDDDLIGEICSRMVDYIEPADLVRCSSRAIDVYLRLLTNQGRLRRRDEAIELLLSAGCNADRFLLCMKYLATGGGERLSVFGHTLIILASTIAQLEPARTEELQEVLLQFPGFLEYLAQNIPVYARRICAPDGVGRFIQGTIDLSDSSARLGLVARVVEYARHHGDPLPAISWAAEQMMGIEVDEESISVLNEGNGELAKAVLVACFDQLRQSLIASPDLVLRAVTIISGLSETEQRLEWLLEFAQTVAGQIHKLSDFCRSGSAAPALEER